MIGPLVPGVETTVTPDTDPPAYESVDGPAVDGPVVATDVLQPIEVALNVQQMILNRLQAGVYRIRSGSFDDMRNTVSLDGDVFLVEDVGLYVFVDMATAPFSDPWAAQGIGNPYGYWVHTSIGLSYGNKGFARVGPLEGIDESTLEGKIPLDLQTNRVVIDNMITMPARLNELALTASTNTFDIALLGALQVNDHVCGSLDNIWLMCLSPVDQNAKVEVLLVSSYPSGPETAVIATHNMLTLLFTEVPRYALPMSFAGAISKAGQAKLQIRLTGAGDASATLYGADATTFNIGHYWIYRP